MGAIASYTQSEYHNVTKLSLAEYSKEESSIMVIVK